MGIPLLNPGTKSGNIPLVEKKTHDFTVQVALCVHRAIHPKVVGNLMILEKCPNPKMRVAIKWGDALIDRARAQVATNFLLETKDDILFFIDDDIVFDPLDIRKIARLCYDKKLDIVGAPYLIKTEENPTLAIRTLENGKYMLGEGSEVTEVRYVSTGCMAIRREVLQKMVDVKNVHLCHPDTYKFYPFFKTEERKINGKWLYLSEDWAFCERARDLGFKVWLDTTTKLGHIGEKVYDWDDLVRPPKQKYNQILYNVDVKYE